MLAKIESCTDCLNLRTPLRQLVSCIALSSAIIGASKLDGPDVETSDHAKGSQDVKPERPTSWPLHKKH